MARIAFFDLDKTLLSVNSGTLWVRRELALGHLTKRQALRAAAWLARYHFGFASAESMVEDAVAQLTGTSAAALRARTEQFYEEEVQMTFRPGAIEAVEQHRAMGARLVMLTSSTSYLADLAARTLRFDEVLANELEADAEGRHTGRVRNGVCFGAGKLVHASRCARAAGVELQDTTFFTDSFSDRAVMDAVGRPVAVNPDVRLRRYAQQRGWSVVDWGVPSRRAA